MAYGEILSDTKKLLGAEGWLDAFDTDICIGINTALMTLRQLGVGTEGITVSPSDEEPVTWDEFLADQSDLDLEAVKNYVALRVRLLFDPPTSSTVKQAVDEALREYEWRLNVAVDPDTTFS